MNADRIYAAILRLYPASFRDEYGSEMLSTFRDLRASRRSTAARFWLFIVCDLCASAARERLEGQRWLATALFGLAATIATAQLTTFGYRYFYHPYFEGTAIRPLPYGLLLGIVLGVSVAAAQRVLFPAAERRAGRWALVSAVTLPAAVLFCSTAVDQVLAGLQPLAQPHHPVALDVLVVGIGRDWTALATQFAAMTASALVIRTALSPRHGH